MWHIWDKKEKEEEEEKKRMYRVKPTKTRPRFSEGLQ